MFEYLSILDILSIYSYSRYLDQNRQPCMQNEPSQTNVFYAQSLIIASSSPSSSKCSSSVSCLPYLAIDAKRRKYMMLLIWMTHHSIITLDYSILFYSIYLEKIHAFSFWDRSSRDTSHY